MFTTFSRTGRTGVRRGARSGFTLAEVLVAIAVFAVVSAIAMTLYQQLQKSFKQGDNAAAQQQNTRIAFDRLVADLRMAGFNYNPDGAGARPDEQIEGMWQNALTIRADFDYGTGDAATPESSLGGPTAPFNIVSTGNDEIVTYALGKPSGAGGTSIQFQADVTAVPRDGTLDTVTINNVHLDMNSPPYTLYRITLKPGGTALSNIADRQPVADDIRSLEFTYYDGAGNVLATMAGGMDDPNSIALRKKIAKIGVRIVGMTHDPDLAYFDPADTNPASLHYRKYELASDVTPRNLGFVGIPDLDLDLPGTPTGLSVCAGHCEGLWTTWNPNPSNEGVVKYTVTYGPSQISQGNAQDAFATSLYISGLDPNGSYVVGVAAVDSAGNQSDPAAFSSPAAMSNVTVPAPPGTASATSIGGGNAQPNRIDVWWNRPTENTSATALACDGSPHTPLRDLRGYRLYRGATAGFDPNVPAQIQASWDPNTLQGSDPDPNAEDASVVNCRTYYYKVGAEDLCGLASTVASAAGSASTNVPPAPPPNVTATDMGAGTTLVTWNPVTQDVSAPPETILIDKYKVWRAAVPAGNDPNAAYYMLVWDGTVSSISSPSFTDPNVPHLTGGQDWYYRVSALDDCPNESAASYPALVTKCNFNGTIQVAMSPGGNPVAGLQRITVTATGGAVPVGSRLVVRDTATGTVIMDQSSTSYPYSYVWQANTAPTLPGRSYDVIASVTNDQGCTEASTSTVSVSSTVACCISAANPRLTNNTTLGSVSGGSRNNEVDFQIVNSCGADITIVQIAMDWNNLTTNSPQLTAWKYGGYPDIVLSPPVNAISTGISPVSKFDLRYAPFTPYSLPRTNDILNPKEVGYVFTRALVAKIQGNPVGDTVNTQYTFMAVGLIGTGRCTVSVLADPNTPGITLCDPQVDPNCPGF